MSLFRAIEDEYLVFGLSVGSPGNVKSSFAKHANSVSLDHINTKAVIPDVR